MKKIKILIAKVAVGTAALPVIGFAANGNGDGNGDGNGEEETTIDRGPTDTVDTLDTGADTTSVESLGEAQSILTAIVGWVQIFFYIVATLFIILAAWSYLTSGGNEEKIAGAKNKVIYAVVAIAIAVIAGGVVRLVENFINVAD